MTESQATSGAGPAGPLFTRSGSESSAPGRGSFLPTNREEMARRGWEELDILLISGDAYVDHPSFGAAVIGRCLEREGFRVGVLAQPDWRSDADFQRLPAPKL